MKRMITLAGLGAAAVLAAGLLTAGSPAPAAPAAVAASAAETGLNTPAYTPAGITPLTPAQVKAATSGGSWYLFRKYPSTGYCLAVPYTNGQPSGSGTATVLWHCYNTYSNFYWGFYPMPAGSTWAGWYSVVNQEVYDPAIGWICLDDHGTLAGERIKVWTCNHTNSQAWRLGTDNNGTTYFYNPGGMCISMPYAVQDGAWVIAQRCSDLRTSPARDWSLTAN